jgi:SulP family sulfate permease
MTHLNASKAWLHQALPFLHWWPRVDAGTLRHDATAGLTGAMVVLPQAVAFATLAGLPPQYGLYAAMIPTIVAALFGSSWHLVSGPTTAISIVVFASVAPIAEPGSVDYIRLVLTLTFLTGLFQLAMGLARLGVLVNFISHTVIVAFTAGAALIIAASQAKNFFGIDIARGAHFHEVFETLATRAGEINPYVTAVAVVTLLSGILARRYLKRVPYMIVAMVVGSIVAALVNLQFGQDTTGIRTVGELRIGLPPLSLPDFSVGAIKNTFFSALVVTVLALTEAVSIARSIAVKSEQRIDGNQEFIGQGLSNLVGSFFSGYAASVFSALFLLGIVLLVAPLAAWLPTAAMGAILFLVAWGLIDFHAIREIWTFSRAETTVFLVTFVGTLIELEKGIFLGIITSLVFYLLRTARPAVRDLVPDPQAGPLSKRKFVLRHPGLPDCPQLSCLRVEGSIFFGAVDHVQKHFTAVDAADSRKKWLLVLARGVNFIDLAGAELLHREARRRRALGGGLAICGVKEGVCAPLHRGGHIPTIGDENLYDSKSEAIADIHPRLDPAVCATCTTRIFRECGQPTGG